MCGIHASISRRGHHQPSEQLKTLLCNRGPDHLGHHTDQNDHDGISTFLSFASTVLALRGGHVTKQPFVDEATGSVLCWNGEAWRINGQPITGNDGQAVFNLLLTASTAQPRGSDSIECTLDALRTISGPFAFVFYDRPHDLIFFGRDCLGRRSLLFEVLGNTEGIQFSSVAGSPGSSWQEVEADGIYVLSTSTTPDPLPGQPFIVPEFDASQFPVFRYKWEPSLETTNRTIDPSKPRLSVESDSVQGLQEQLQSSLRLRVLGVPKPPTSTPENDARIAVLFSGGVDCTLLARMAHDLVPMDQPIDLLNVAFENPRVVQAALKQSRKTQGSASDPPRSGEAMASTQASPGDLSENSPYEACPDRLTGRKAFDELQVVCPGRKWRFVEINVPYEENIAHRPNVVSLMYPHNTEMDLSITSALYFASRGVGMVKSPNEPVSTTYTSPARVLLSGLGADELFGGYTRHATAFSRGGFDGLLEELDLDVGRLGKRNLGRDDRVICHWGKEVRFPFLDENLVRWALDCPVQEKCGFGSPVQDSNEQDDLGIEPGKQVLRLLAYKLGMKSVAHEKKRAIQFGARTAKMETGRTKGTTLISST